MSKNYLIHYGILGMKWGVRKDKDKYRSTGLKAYIARKQNQKVDKGFDEWKINAKKKQDAIDKGLERNKAKIQYELNKSDKALKDAYKKANKDYKKALSSNTTYRKGQIRSEVGKDLSRKYLSEAKRTYKILKSNPSNKDLQKKYSYFMSEHDKERASARRAPEVGARRSRRIASLKGAVTHAVKGLALTAAFAAGATVVNSYITKGKVSLNADDFKDTVKRVKNLIGYIY